MGNFSKVKNYSFGVKVFVVVDKTVNSVIDVDKNTIQENDLNEINFIVVNLESSIVVAENDMKKAVNF